jgi:sulfur carrier protein ThiS
MKIHLRYAAILKIEGFANDSDVEIDENTSIADLLSAGKISEEQQRYLLCYANGRKKPLSTILQDGDALQLLIPAGGG